MVEKTFHAPNISCNHCVMTIKNELSEIPGVLKVEGDAESKNLSVAWEDPASEEKIRAVLAEINYPAD